MAGPIRILICDDHALLRSGLKRLLGRATGPITLSFDHTASGPASRRHETVDFSAMPPGSYALFLVVTDSAGRARERRSEFQVR